MNSLANLEGKSGGGIKEIATAYASGNSSGAIFVTGLDDGAKNASVASIVYSAINKTGKYLRVQGGVVYAQKDGAFAYRYDKHTMSGSVYPQHDGAFTIANFTAGDRIAGADSSSTVIVLAL